MKVYGFSLGLLLTGVLLLGGCGQLEVGIEPSVQDEPTATTTEGAARTTATPTRERTAPTLQPVGKATSVPSHTVAPSATAEPSPTYTPTLPPPAPTDTAVPAAPTNTAVPATTDVPLPTIHQFSVSPQTVEPRTRLRLNWDAAGDRAEICVFQNGYAGYRECRETAVSGALAWELDDMLRDDFAVELSVSRGEQVVIEAIPVAVTCPVAEDWWFFTPAPVGCPGADAVTTQAAAQLFERGWMLWLEAEDVIYAFFDDNTYAQFYGYELWGDTETGNGGVVAPEGLVAPVRGFGLVWRGEADGAENGWVGDKIGWGLAAEFGFQTQYQRDTHASFSGIYVRDADGRIIYLDPSLSTWYVFHEPG